MDSNALLDWEKRHHAVSRALEGFWSYFNAWKKENRDRYIELFAGKLDNDFIATQVTSISLMHRFDCDPEYAVVSCQISIFYLDQEIGHYRMDFQLNGETENDFLHFHEKEWMHALRLQSWKSGISKSCNRNHYNSAPHPATT